GCVSATPWTRKARIRGGLSRSCRRDNPSPAARRSGPLLVGTDDEGVADGGRSHHDHRCAPGRHGLSLPPVILLVLHDQWPRSLLRAELIERGYDAVGAPDLRTAFRLPSLGEPRGP